MKILSADKRYVVGFLFSEDLSEVLLVHKNRPEFQVGKLNGIGGGVEPNETVQQAQSRELQEESGVWIEPTQWFHFANMTLDKGLHVSFLAAVREEGSLEPQTMTDESVHWTNAQFLPDNALQDLRFLVPLAQQIVAGKKITQPIEFTFADS